MDPGAHGRPVRPDRGTTHPGRDGPSLLAAQRRLLAHLPGGDCDERSLLMSAQPGAEERRPVL